MAKKLPASKEKTCKHCGHNWVARVEIPKICPSCHNPHWNKTEPNT
jgi:rubrerythrin